MANILVLFAEKNVKSFCIAKDAHMFAAKISMFLKILLATTVKEFVFCLLS